MNIQQVQLSGARKITKSNIYQSQPYKQFKSAWAFSKGHLEAGETAQEAAKREIFEEVGLKLEFNFDFSESYSYQVTSEIEKTVTLFLAKYNPDQKIKQTLHLH